MERYDKNFMFSIDVIMNEAYIFKDLYITKLIKKCSDITEKMFEIISNTDGKKLFELQTNDLGLQSKYLKIVQSCFDAKDQVVDHNKYFYLMSRKYLIELD